MRARPMPRIAPGYSRGRRLIQVIRVILHRQLPVILSIPAFRNFHGRPTDRARVGQVVVGDIAVPAAGAEAVIVDVEVTQVAEAAGAEAAGAEAVIADVVVTQVAAAARAVAVTQVAGAPQVAVAIAEDRFAFSSMSITAAAKCA